MMIANTEKNAGNGHMIEMTSRNHGLKRHPLMYAGTRMMPRMKTMDTM